MQSPSKTQANRKAPESPDMKFARNRLGNLLSGMRGSDVPPPIARLQQNRESPYDSGDEYADEDSRKDPFAFGGDSTGRRGMSGRRGRGPGRRPRERRVVFELRGKPFELRDSGKEEAVFSLCRTWMRGKEDDIVKNEPDEPNLYPQPADDCLDLLATKEIHSLPHPRSDVAEPPLVPAYVKKAATPAQLDVNDARAIISDYMPHWRATKKRWTEHTKLREKRYSKSIQLLETVFSIAQQNQLMA
uniref:Uncharacterized protein n=1 Tax=Plectus sambesii TaxID=2011161 RepID=A0A914V5E1_9BILA